MNINYANYLIRNYPLNEYNNKYIQYGGKNILDTPNTPDTQNIPTGGFPPIYICKGNKTYADIQKEEETMKKREYTSHQTTVKIQDILQKRRNITPFV